MVSDAQLRAPVRDAVIVEAVRTPIGRRGGRLAGWHPADLLGFALTGLFERSGVDPGRIDDVIGGCVTETSEQGCNVTRNAWVSAGLPWDVASTTVDRQCGSSQQAVHFAAQGVMAGAYDAVVACGVESMSRVPLSSNAWGGESPFSRQFLGQVDGQLLTQFQVAQKIADDSGLTRSDMDEFSVESHARACEATDTGAFEREIVSIQLRDDGGTSTAKTMSADEGIRPATTVGALAQLEPATKEYVGIDAPDITAGNSSQQSDGAAAMLITSRATAEELGLEPRARFEHFTVGAHDPIWVLTAPNPVTRKALRRSGFEIGDFDAIEVNEAFASVAMSWANEFRPDPLLLNPRGGAIALGHPLGASGVRLMTTMLHYLEDTGGRYGFQVMCEGGGQANATIIERL